MWNLCKNIRQGVQLMDTEQSERLMLHLVDIKRELKRIAEVEKMHLWWLMETQANQRQKGIISDVLKKL